MSSFVLDNRQLTLIENPIGRKIFLEGPGGAGKTTAGVWRLLHLLDSGVPAGSILVIVPQRTLAAPYHEALRRSTVRAGGQVEILTVGGLARRMVDLYWPLIAPEAGFNPDQPPIFLTLETAQYYMARLVRPLLDQGYFETVTINRNRLYSQIIDNLNKAAVVGFPYSEIGERLKAAWQGEPSQLRVYDEAQACATRFREYCLAHNLLDFSLQLETFIQHLWTLPLCRDYLLSTYTHIFADNIEEDTPVAHDLLKAWLPNSQSALLIYDQEAGYRRFLGASPESAAELRDLCQDQVFFSDSLVTSSDMQSLGYELAHSLNRPTKRMAGDIPSVLAFGLHDFHPQMLDWVAGEIARLVIEEGTPAGEVVVLAPFLTDALRFALTNRLGQYDVRVRSHRPSRALREEPATRCLLTLAAIAHPAWGICPSRFEVAYALKQAVGDLDLVRAQLMADIVYRVRDGVPTLSPFDQINPDMHGRLTYVLGGRYEGLRTWIEDYVASGVKISEAFDHFLSRLFGEVLSQEGYGFHGKEDAGQVAANLIESVQKFRWVTEGDLTERANGKRKPLGQEYLEMVQDGVIAAQYIRSWQIPAEDSVLLAPAYTFLMSNRPVDCQFWLGLGSRGWWERLYQPLTHPYVLSRGWDWGAIWTDADEFETRQEALYRLTLGLIRRCRRKIFLGLSNLDEQGYEQQGPLLQAVQRVLRHQGGH